MCTKKELLTKADDHRWRERGDWYIVMADRDQQAIERPKCELSV